MKIDESKLEQIVDNILTKQLKEAPPTPEDEEEEDIPINPASKKPAPAPSPEPATQEPAPEADPAPAEQEPAPAEQPTRAEDVVNSIKNSKINQQLNRLTSNKEKIKAIIKFSELVGIPKNQLSRLFSQMKQPKKPAQ